MERLRRVRYLSNKTNGCAAKCTAVFILQRKVSCPTRDNRGSAADKGDGSAETCGRTSSAPAYHTDDDTPIPQAAAESALSSFRARQCLALSALDIILYQCTAVTADRRIERFGGDKRAVVADLRLSARTLAEPLLPTGAPCTGVYHSDIIVFHQPPHTF